MIEMIIVSKETFTEYRFSDRSPCPHICTPTLLNCYLHFTHSYTKMQLNFLAFAEYLYSLYNYTFIRELPLRKLIYQNTPKY